jgi:hypothetical protein
LYRVAPIKAKGKPECKWYSGTLANNSVQSFASVKGDFPLEIYSDTTLGELKEILKHLPKVWAPSEIAEIAFNEILFWLPLA